MPYDPVHTDGEFNTASVMVESSIRLKAAGFIKPTKIKLAGVCP